MNNLEPPHRPRATFPQWIFWPVVIALVCLLTGRQIHSIVQESETNDEGAHLSAGYSYWKTHDFRLVPSHPPLAELVYALPLLILQPDFAPSPEAWANADEGLVGNEFLYHNRIPADTLLLAGRLMAVLVTGAFGVALAWWCRKHFGIPAALFCLFLFTFDPTVIAHGRYITTDMMVTAFLVCSCLSWLDYLKSGTTRSMIITGVLTGLTIACKFSGLILYPVLIIMYLANRRINRTSPRTGKPVIVSLAAFVLIPYLIVCSMFFFDTRSVLQDPLLGSRLMGKQGLSHFLAGIPVPAYYYGRGLQLLFRDLHGGHYGYLMGQETTHGSWTYFPVTFAVKTPMADVALLLLCSLLVAARVRRREAIPVVWLGIVIPPVVYFMVSMTSSMNIGVRHILPVYPFLFILIAAVLFGPRDQTATRYRRVAQTAGLLLCGLLSVESLGIHPNYLTFFNSLAGGPENGPHYLIDSNLDWGQDLKKLKLWTEQHADVPLCLSYFGQAAPEYYGIAYQPLDTLQTAGEISGANCVVAVSAHFLYGTESIRFRALHGLRPKERIGFSIYIYDLRKNQSAEL